jgi:hypothetical protein
MCDGHIAMNELLPVTLVTVNAGRAEDDETYMRELRNIRDGDNPERRRLTLAEMVRLFGEPENRKAFWSHRLSDPPTRTTFPPEARAAIRKAVGEAPLPPVAEVVETLIDPNAAMYMIGDLEPGERVRRVLMLANSDSVQIYANGSISAYTHPIETLQPVTPPVAVQGAKREPVYRPVLSLAMKERIQASGATVEELIEAGLKAMEGRE